MMNTEQQVEEIMRLALKYKEANNGTLIQVDAYQALEQAVRKLVEQQGIVTVTCNEAGQAVAVTRTDEDHRILSVIWESPKVSFGNADVTYFKTIKAKQDTEAIREEVFRKEINRQVDETIRNAALEEAAIELDTTGYGLAAHRIRAMKSAAPSPAKPKGAVIEMLECRIGLLQEALAAICADTRAVYESTNSGKPLVISIGQWGRLHRAETRTGAATPSTIKAE